MSDLYDPRNFHIDCDKEGFFIANDMREDMDPCRRWHSVEGAKAPLGAMVESYVNAERRHHQRIADRIDGYDRDDLGESLDF